MQFTQILQLLQHEMTGPLYAAVMLCAAGLLLACTIRRVRTGDSANAILDSMSHMLLVLQPDLRIEKVNQACQAGLGYSKEVLQGTSATALFTLQDPTGALDWREEADPAALAALLEKQEVKAEMLCHTREGGGDAGGGNAFGYSGQHRESGTYIAIGHRYYRAQTGGRSHGTA